MRIAWLAMHKGRVFLAEHHRHLKEVAGAILCLGEWQDDKLVGVAFIGRPQARLSDDGYTIEITRLATDGTRNAGSKLYAHCKRQARLLGATKITTKTLPEESGASLRAAGFVEDGMTKGGEWNRKSRPRGKAANAGPKRRWKADL